MQQLEPHKLTQPPDPQTKTLSIITPQGRTQKIKSITPKAATHPHPNDQTL